MTKFAFALVGLFSVGAANAVVLNGEVQQPDCALLNEDVRLSMSNNVASAYRCDTANNRIIVTGCHTSGRTTSRTETAPGPAGCVAVVVNQGDVVCSANTPQRITTTGSVVWTASTAGGQLLPDFPGTTCDAAGAVADQAATDYQ